ncbi:glycosyltransferase involved in cell wall biosynthesis [Mucilaginibacter yixingensis]|uniref:Glycosyltransferase involved in cell wall biosynthesis n=1 Tax=Mucilaginibacter yixingensis TaxID=1295612 RepID=A0A2T5JC59_9SPHI|nr:glycosyltransferase family 4 protein [Mucilaginibacter yixingensis]PTQ99357.1 glycosyltransferase involved in cell wall biosynthesis [Mucilaginibacter yixingensis]
MDTGLDFYLSEMSASEKHGGGLTLHRVLGDDLKKIRYFIHANRFADDMAPAADLAGKCISKHSVWENDGVRRITGRTFAAKMRRKPSVIKKQAAELAKLADKQLGAKKELKALICPQGADAICTLAELRQRRNIKYITWVMDDHLVKYVDGSWKYDGWIEPIFARHLQQADQVLVISPAMQAFYKERFGVESTVVFGPADDAASAVEFKTSVAAEGLKIGYFGAVARWQKDVLAAVAQSVQGANCSLDIYSAAEAVPGDILLPGVNFKGRIAADKVLPTMQQYHAILLPIGFADGLRNMSQFNIATKMSESLACGVPVLAIGPPYAAMTDYLKTHDAALVVERADAKSIRAAFEVFADGQQINKILNNAAKLVASETGTAAMHGKWRAAYQHLIQSL